MKWNSLNTVRLRHNVGTGISGAGGGREFLIGSKGTFVIPFDAEKL